MDRYGHAAITIRGEHAAVMWGWIDEHRAWHRAVRPVARVHGGLRSAPCHFRPPDGHLAALSQAPRPMRRSEEARPVAPGRAGVTPAL